MGPGSPQLVGEARAFVPSLAALWSPFLAGFFVNLTQTYTYLGKWNLN